MKKFAAIFIIIVLLFGIFAGVFGIGKGGNLADRLNLGLDMIGGASVVMRAETTATGSELKSIMDQVQAVMEKRVNEMGLSEPVIAIENDNCIRIDLPGAEDAQEAIDVIGRTAQLAFVTADGQVILDGSHVKNATAEVYNGNEAMLLGTYMVTLEFDSVGQDAFAEATRRIVNGEIKSTNEAFTDNMIIIMLDDEVISYPMVNQVINSSNCIITGGNFTASTAGNLAALIRGGSLPVPLTEIQTEIVGPTLGLDAAKTSAIAGLLGIVIVFVIMFAAYGLMGAVANIALALYCVIVLWSMAAFNAVLTLPGIAGIILSAGMAVDSNVLIFARIREEIKVGKSVRVAVNSGFKRALTTIIDSQVTTIIAAVILYEIGSGTVRGFAMTLLIGIVASIFTACFVSQILLSLVADSRKLATAKNFGVKEIKDESPVEKFDFLGHRKIFYCVAGGCIVLGLALGFIRGFNLGIDFTGGTMLQYNLGSQQDASEIKNIFKDYGIDVDVQNAGAENEKVIVRTTAVISNDDRAAIGQAIRDKYSITAEEGDFLEQAGLIGPSVGTQLKQNAIKAIILAGIAMLIYVAIRFEWRFGVASILALCHDALMLFALYGLFHIQMNSPFIAGLLIVIGYSINDTIVVFDRIRENLHFQKQMKREKIINISIWQSVSRSILTSLTTMAAIIPLIIMCGDTIRAFALPLICGVLFGTVSSLCIASAFYYDIFRLTKKNKYHGK